jgi:hypothetical protein
MSDQQAGTAPEPQREAPGTALRGVAIGILFSAPFWLAIALCCGLL